MAVSSTNFICGGSESDTVTANVCKPLIGLTVHYCLTIKIDNVRLANCVYTIILYINLTSTTLI